MKPAPFEHHAPTTVHDAVRLLAELGDAKVLAGGQSLIPMLALRLTGFEHLVDLGRIPELVGIERQGTGAGHDVVRIGAMTTEAAVEHSPEVAAGVPLLAKASPHVGHFQIRNRGTLGGVIAHADPAAEYPAVALALDATMEAVGPSGRRTIAAADFFDGLWSTTLEPDEVLTSVTFPVWGPRSGFGVEELARRHGDFAMAGAVVGLQVGADDRVQRCAIGLIGMGSTPLRATAAETATIGQAVHGLDLIALGQTAVGDLDNIPNDLHGTADYRRRVGAVMVERALAAAIIDERSAA